MGTEINGLEQQFIPPFASADGFRARFKGWSGTAEAGEVTNIDYLVSEERYINGVNIILCSHAEDDTIDFQIVDVDNILGAGANYVLDTFGEAWNVDPAIKSQGAILVPYPAKILANLYIRIKYHSTGLLDVKIKANGFLHKKY